NGHRASVGNPPSDSQSRADVADIVQGLHALQRAHKKTGAAPNMAAPAKRYVSAPLFRGDRLVRMFATRTVHRIALATEFRRQIRVHILRVHPLELAVHQRLSNLVEGVVVVVADRAE